MVKILSVLIYLLILSVYDIRRKEVPGLFLKAGTLIAACYEVCMLIGGNLVPGEFLTGILPGVLFLLASRATGKVGIGDGWLLLNIYPFLSTAEYLFAFAASLFLTGAVSIILLSFRKAKRNTAIPYIPFLTVSVFIVGLNGLFHG